MYVRPRVLYVRKTKIKNIWQRQNYLTNHKKQENLMAYTRLDVLEEHLKVIKDKNKELIIEIPNELKRHDTDYDELLNIYIAEFRQKTGYEYVAGAIHINKADTNLHLHLSYVDRKLEVREEFYKKDKYINANGKKLNKERYNKNNPSHILIKAGQPKLDFSKIDEATHIDLLGIMQSVDSTNSVKFKCQREIIKLASIPKVELSPIMIESNNKITSKKLIEISKDYNKFFADINNNLLDKAGFTYDNCDNKKYVSKERYEDLGYVTKKKIGMMGVKLSDLQQLNENYNINCDEYLDTIDILHNSNNTAIAEQETQRFIKYEEKYKKVNYFERFKENFRQGILNIYEKLKNNPNLTSNGQKSEILENIHNIKNKSKMNEFEPLENENNNVTDVECGKFKNIILNYEIEHIYENFEEDWQNTLIMNITTGVLYTKKYGSKELYELEGYDYEYFNTIEDLQRVYENDGEDCSYKIETNEENMRM